MVQELGLCGQADARNAKPRQRGRRIGRVAHDVLDVETIRDGREHLRDLAGGALRVGERTDLRLPEHAQLLVLRREPRPLPAHVHAGLRCRTE